MSDEVDFVGYSPRQIAEASCRAFCMARVVQLHENADDKPSAEKITAEAKILFDYIMPEGWAADHVAKRKTNLRAVEVKKDD